MMKMKIRILNRSKIPSIVFIRHRRDGESGVAVRCREWRWIQSFQWREIQNFSSDGDDVGVAWWEWVDERAVAWWWDCCCCSRVRVRVFAGGRWKIFCENVLWLCLLLLWISAAISLPFILRNVQFYLRNYSLIFRLGVSPPSTWASFRIFCSEEMLPSLNNFSNKKLKLSSFLYSPYSTHRWLRQAMRGIEWVTIRSAPSKVESARVVCLYTLNNAQMMMTI